MQESQLLVLQEAQTQVTEMLQNKLHKNIKFHTLEHTQEVVAACQVLADNIQLNNDDRFALYLAAWFHDTGYTSGNPTGHEEVSIQIADAFMHAKNITVDVKEKVRRCINATKMPQTPDGLLEQIICDADLFHLGTDTFYEKGRLLRKELNEFGDNSVSKKEWRKINIRFLERHEYFTAYGKEKLQPVQQQHLADLLEKDEKNHDTMKPEKKEKVKDKQKAKEKDPEALAITAEVKLKREKEKEADRSIATVFRIMAQNHSALSQMADSKANILISVCSIILSLLIGSLIEKLQTDTYLQMPMGVITLVCVTTIIFGILATRPNVSHGTFSREDISQKRANLLFFGNFHGMSLQDYNWGMTEMLGDKEYMNNSMIKDNYFLGVVLAKKYRYLRIAYNIFMYGLILTVIAFAVSFMLPQATEVYT
ncbi:MAG: Pycsar system effector family protein [Chitinophagaceae bacterium]